MRIGVLASPSSNTRGLGWHFHDLQRAATELGVDLVPLDYTTLATEVSSKEERVECTGSLSELDGLLVRAMPRGTLEQVVFRMDALDRLNSTGIRVVNPPKAIECAVDKYLALARLSAAGLDVPRTRTTEYASRALLDFEILGGDVVVKPLFGSEGRGIFRVCERTIAERSYRALESIGAVIYQQEFIDNAGWDLRVFVLGDRPLCAMRRVASGDDETGRWKTNISCGGSGEPHDLTDEEAGLAMRAARAVGTEIAGVDLIPTHHGYRVLEVNSSPGWRTLSRVTGVDVATALLGYLADV